MKDYIKFDVGEVEEIRSEYKEAKESIEVMLKEVGKLITNFATENSGDTANKIIEILEEYENLLATNEDVYDAFYDSVDDFLDIVEEHLDPPTDGEVLIEYEDMLMIKTELDSMFDNPNAIYEKLLDDAIDIIEEERKYLERKKLVLESEEENEGKNLFTSELDDLQYNKRQIESLTAELKHGLKFDEEIEEIEDELKSLKDFLEEEDEIDVSYLEDYINELKAFKLEVNVHALTAVLPKEITNSLVTKVLDKLKANESDVLDKINELKENGMLGNLYANIDKQVELMGLEAFLSDPNRIKWLANNPEVRVGDFQSDLTPDQLRILCEELPYVLFSKNEDGEFEFKSEFYGNLTRGDYGGDVALNKSGTKLVFTDHFLNSNITFEKINKPGTDEPWYIDENGFQAVAMRANGELVILYPGSQEVDSDWIGTDLLPNLKHEVPMQYEQAAEFASEVSSEYPNDEIILLGQSLAGGSAEYAGNKNDMMSFAIDPAPGVVSDNNSKGITVIPGGENEGLLNSINQSGGGYNQSDTDVKPLDSFPIGTKPISNYGEKNDKPSDKETAYLNSISEKNDLTEEEISDIKELGPNDGTVMNLLTGDHFVGDLDDDFIYAYVPRGEN